MSDGQTPNCTTVVIEKDKHHDEPVKPKPHEVPVKPKHQDQSVKPKEESPAQNHTTMEIELQIFKNNTGRFSVTMA